MRVTIGHRKSRQEAIQIVDQSFDDIFKGLPIAPLEITGRHRSWSGSILTFALVAKLGFIQNPVHGTVEVTDKDITIDADLGMLEKLISRGKFKAAVEGGFRRLLPG